jgi:hypothetical protein
MEENTMEQLTRWIPEDWRTSLVQLRDAMHGIVERWLSKRHNDTNTHNGNVPMHYGEIVEDRPFWTPARFMVSSPRLDVNEIDDEVVVTADTTAAL